MVADGTTMFHWVEAVGWLASALTVATYAMNTMIPLRILAIASSVCFAIYASVLQLWPLLAMELLLLPINLYRFWQIISLRGKITASAGSSEDFTVIKTYGKARVLAEDTTVFEKGDPVDSLYYLSSGRIYIEEFDVELRSGDIFGEIAFFTDEAIRTATARCLEHAEVFELDRRQFMRLQFEDPSFGMAIMRTITRRLAVNAAYLGKKSTACPTTA